MKVLCISKNGRELVRSPVRTAAVLVGRSPSCDIVLRAKDLKPVQFLIEWTGVGTFGTGDGVWSIFDVSGNTTYRESATEELGTGEGVVLDKQKVSLGGYEFEWKMDRLFETELEGGALSESFLERSKNNAAIANYYQLEVVSARTDSGSLTNVYHLAPPAARNTPIPLVHLPEIKVSWSAGDTGVPVFFDLNLLKDAQILQKGVPVKPNSTQKNFSVRLSPGDLIQIQWNLKDHYFRLVPGIHAPPVGHSFLGDSFQWLTVIALILAGLVMTAIHMGDFKAPEEIKPPPRIAEIEVKEVAPQPPPPPPQEQEEQTPDTKTKAAPEAPRNKPAAAAPTFKTANASKKPKSGLNSPAPKADVNSIGLLGAMKAKHPGHVSADKVINDGIISKTVSGAQGNIQVQQAPSGVVASHDSPGNLTGAYTTMNMKDTADDDSSGAAIAFPGDKGSGLSYAKSVGSLSAAENGTNNAGDFSAEGGLDKESVRRALAAYRKDIRTCYDRALVTKPKIKGRIVYKWMIMPEGPVSWVKLLSSDTGSPILASCVQSVIKTIRFPAAPNGQATIVIFPFQFVTKS